MSATVSHATVHSPGNTRLQSGTDCHVWVLIVFQSAYITSLPEIDG